MAFMNPCGGLRWETLPDGTIEIEGQGVAAFEPGTLRFQQMQDCWDNWRSLISAAAGTAGIPARWILAVICQETGLWSANAAEQAAKIAPDGGLGLMQIMPATARAFGASPEDMLDPTKNIQVGAALLAKLASSHDGELPEIVASYNAGSVRCGAANPWNMVTSGDYITNAVQWNNAAVLHLDMRQPRLLLGLALALGGVYAGALIAGIVTLPKGVRAWMS